MSSFEQFPTFNNEATNNQKEETEVEKIEKTKEESFEKQFSDIQDLDGLEIVNIKSENENEKNPIVFAPGWSRTMDTFKNSLETLHNKDRNILSLNHTRENSEIEQSEETKDLPSELQRRATSLKKLIDKEIADGNTKIDMIGQSMGGMDTLVATLLSEAENPGCVKNIVLVDPAGMIGKDSMFKLGKRFSGQMKQNVEVKTDTERPESAKDNVKVAGSEFFKYLKDNPARAIKEVSAMTSVEIMDILEDLNSRGVNICIMHGVDDLTFPMDKVQENAKGRLDEENGNFIGFASVRGSHNELYLNPEQYMGAAEGLLSAQKEKNAKKNN